MAWGKTGGFPIVMMAGKHFACLPAIQWRVAWWVLSSLGRYSLLQFFFYHLCLLENAEHGWGTPDWQVFSASTEAVFPNVQTKD